MNIHSWTTAWDKFICILGFPEIRNEMHRVTRNLKECQSLSQTYNQRERLFGMPATQVGAWSHRWGCGCYGEWEQPAIEAVWDVVA